MIKSGLDPHAADVVARAKAGLEQETEQEGWARQEKEKQAGDWQEYREATFEKLIEASHKNNTGAIWRHSREIAGKQARKFRRFTPQKTASEEQWDGEALPEPVRLLELELTCLDFQIEQMQPWIERLPRHQERSRQKRIAELESQLLWEDATDEDLLALTPHIFSSGR